MSNHPHHCTLARLRPELAAAHPSIPSGHWYVVLSRNSLALSPRAEPGLVWVKVEGRRRKLPAAYFEFAHPKTSADLLHRGRPVHRLQVLASRLAIQAVALG